MNNLLKNIGIWLVIGLVVLTVVKQFDTRQAVRDTVAYSEFMDRAKAGQVESASVEGRKIIWSLVIVLLPVVGLVMWFVAAGTFAKAKP